VPAGETGCGCGPADRCTPPHIGVLHSAPKTACSCSVQGLFSISSLNTIITIVVFTFVFLFIIVVVVVVIIIIIIMIVTVIININIIVPIIRIITITTMIMSNISINIVTIVVITSGGFCFTHISAEPVLKDKQLLQQMADVHV